VGRYAPASARSARKTKMKHAAPSTTSDSRSHKNGEAVSSYSPGLTERSKGYPGYQDNNTPNLEEVASKQRPPRKNPAPATTPNSHPNSPRAKRADPPPQAATS